MKRKTLSFLSLPLVLIGTSGFLALNLSNDDKSTISNEIQKNNTKSNSVNYIKDISLGESHSAIVVSDVFEGDQLYTWGNNSYGQLGIGTNAGNYSTPQNVEFPIDGTIKQIESGENSTGAVVQETGTNLEYLFVWGENFYNQDLNEFYPMAVQFPINGTIKDFDLGGNFAAAIVTDYSNNDHLYMWGNNEYGQLGIGEKGGVSTPIEIVNNYSFDFSVSEIKDVELGLASSYLTVSDTFGSDHLFMWGNNRKAQIALQPKHSSAMGDIWDNPEIVSPYEFDNTLGGEIIDVEAGVEFAGVIVEDNYGIEHFYAWGDNSANQLGYKTSTGFKYSYKPVEINFDLSYDETFKSISLGRNFGGAVVTDGYGTDHLYTWGNNNYGQLGYYGNALTPQEVIFGSNIGIEFAVGYYHSAAIVTDIFGIDHLYMWGNNGAGQLGNGEMVAEGGSISEPREVNLNNQLDSKNLIYSDFIEQTASDKFTFEITLDNYAVIPDPSLVVICNESREQVGTTELIDTKTVNANTTYTFESTITNYESASNVELYWMIEGVDSPVVIEGTTGGFEFSDPNSTDTTNTTAIVWSTVGVIGILLLIIIIIFIVLYLSKDDKDDKNDDLGNNNNSKKGNKSKKQKEKEAQDKKNSVLDAF